MEADLEFVGSFKVPDELVGLLLRVDHQWPSVACPVW